MPVGVRGSARSSENELLWSRAPEPGLWVETEDARAGSARRMKRQGSFSEQKLARTPSGKAGAAEGGEGMGRSATSPQGRAGEGSDPWINRDFPGNSLRYTFCPSGFKRVGAGGLRRGV